MAYRVEVEVGDGGLVGAGDEGALVVGDVAHVAVGPAVGVLGDDLQVCVAQARAVVARVGPERREGANGKGQGLSAQALRSAP